MLGPDSRTMSTLEYNGILDYHHAARKIHVTDFQKFDFVFAMVWESLCDLPCLSFCLEF
jgi:low molecular weight phosphotyrosine protein phosphatase